MLWSRLYIFIYWAFLLLWLVPLSLLLTLLLVNWGLSFQIILFSLSESLFFANSVCIFVCLFWGKDWVWHTTIKPRSVKSPYMIMELNQSHHLLLGYYYNQSPFPLISQFGQEASSKKSPGCSKLLPLKITESTSVCEPSMQQTKFLTPPRFCFGKKSFILTKAALV